MSTSGPNMVFKKIPATATSKNWVLAQLVRISLIVGSSKTTYQPTNQPASQLARQQDYHFASQPPVSKTTYQSTSQPASLLFCEPESQSARQFFRPLNFYYFSSKTIDRLVRKRLKMVPPKVVKFSLGFL